MQLVSTNQGGAVQRKCARVALSLGAAAAALGLSASSGRASVGVRTTFSGPPSGLTVYGQTLWNLEALLHDTFGNKTTCLRLRDYAFVSTTCGDLADYGYWKNFFASARHSHFKLVRLARPPAMGNVGVITIKGLYVSCGRFPVAFAPLAHEGSRTRRWLVVLHGWAMTPFTCLGQ
jgi:hypothetical protein